MYKYAGLRAVIRQMADGKFKQASWRNKQVTGRKLWDCSSVYFSNSYRIFSTWDNRQYSSGNYLDNILHRFNNMVQSSLLHITWLVSEQWISWQCWRRVKVWSIEFYFVRFGNLLLMKYEWLKVYLTAWSITSLKRVIGLKLLLETELNWVLSFDVEIWIELWAELVLITKSRE